MEKYSTRNAERYIRSYRDLMYQIRRDEERLNMIRGTLKPFKMDGMPRGTDIGDPTSQTASKLVELSLELEARNLEAELKRQEIITTLEKLDPVSQTLLKARYLLKAPALMKWDDVALLLLPFREYSKKHVIGYLHRKALRELEELL